MSVYKNIPPNKSVITPFQSFANNTIDSTIDSQSIMIYKGVFDNYKYSMSDINDSRNNDLIITQDTYEQLVHHGINHLYFYDFLDKPYYKLGTYNTTQRREISNVLFLLSIPNRIFLEGIKKESLTLTISDITSGSVINIYDDGYGNLIDTDKKELVGDLYDELWENLIADYNFNDGFYYEFDNTNKIYNETHLKDNSRFRNHIEKNNITFSKNIRGHYSNYDGIDNYIKIPNSNLLDFKLNDEFAISFLLKTTDSNKYFLNKNTAYTELYKSKSENSNKTYTLKSEYRDVEFLYDYYPFQIGINSSGKLIFEQSDGQNKITSTSITTINDDNWYHIIIQKNTNLEIIINGVLEATELCTLEQNVNNNANIYIGKYYNGVYFEGSIDELKIYNISLTSNQYLNLATLEINNNYNYYVGNIFYETGFLILTSPYYQNLSTNFDFLLKFKSSKIIYEHEYICEISASDLNLTSNPSILSTGTEIDDKFVNNEDWQPYVTTIGLYNDSAQLLAIGKLSRPIPKLNHKDMTFIVKFDI